jgi:hypothetical protein
MEKLLVKTMPSLKSPVFRYVSTMSKKDFTANIQCIYGCYAHSSQSPSFHRRCYWLLKNPRIVLVHYLTTDTPTPRQPAAKAAIEPWGEWPQVSIDDSKVPLLLMLLADAYS